MKGNKSKTSIKVFLNINQQYRILINNEPQKNYFQFQTLTELIAFCKSEDKFKSTYARLRQTKTSKLYTTVTYDAFLLLDNGSIVCISDLGCLVSIRDPSRQRYAWTTTTGNLVNNCEGYSAFDIKAWNVNKDLEVFKAKEAKGKVNLHWQLHQKMMKEHGESTALDMIAQLMKSLTPKQQHDVSVKMEQEKPKLKLRKKRSKLKKSESTLCDNVQSDILISY